MKAVKRQATECENTIAVHMTDKEFISGVKKRLPKREVGQRRTGNSQKRINTQVSNEPLERLQLLQVPLSSAEGSWKTRVEVFSLLSRSAAHNLK